MKKKVSITIDKDILNQIEEISKKQGMNRSKYIERVMLSQTNQIPVLILAAHADIDGTNKSLMEYHNKPIIEHKINHIKNQGLNDIYVSTESKKLKLFLEKHHPEIKIIFEKEKLGNAGTIKAAKELFGRRFLFTYCDTLLDLDLNELIKFHLRNKSEMTLVLKSKKDVSKYGVAVLEGSKIIKFEEKPDKSDSHLIYIGTGIIETAAAEKFNKGKFELQLNQIENKHGYIYEGFWRSFEEMKDFR